MNYVRVPSGAKEGLQTYLRNRRSLLSYFLQQCAPQDVMYSHVVPTSCSVSVNVVCVSPCVQTGWGSVAVSCGHVVCGGVCSMSRGVIGKRCMRGYKCWTPPHNNQ